MRNRSLLLPLILLAVGGLGLLFFAGGFGVVRGGPGAGPWDAVPPGGGVPLSLDEAAGRVREYLAARGNPDLELAEVMEFSNHFYAAVREKAAQRYAFELLVNRITGEVFPEPGPNMMWNRKYGHMAAGGMMGGFGGGWFRGPGLRGRRQNIEAPMPVTAREARERALRFLESRRIGDGVEEPKAFFGYYTFDILKEGSITGMLSVDGYNGDIWGHRWHSRFVRMVEY